MVLEFGLIKSGLFGESETIGVGLGTDTRQVVVFDTGTGTYFLGSYQGTGFDSILANGGGAGATDTHNYTVQLTANALAKFTKVMIGIGYAAWASRVNNWADTAILVEAQETGGGGGGWSTLISQGLAYDGSGSPQSGVATLILVKTLTAGEIMLGLDVKITSTSTCGSGVNNCRVTNKGTILFGVA
jgi:hypothetical protein